MNFCERLNRFHFNDNLIVNPQIGVILSHNLTLVRDVDGFLLLDSKSQLFKLDSQGVLVDFFEKAEPQRVVNFVGAADDYLGEVIIFHMVDSGAKRFFSSFRNSSANGAAKKPLLFANEMQGIARILVMLKTENHETEIMRQD